MYTYELINYPNCFFSIYCYPCNNRIKYKFLFIFQINVARQLTTSPSFNSSIIEDSFEVL